jgi:flagellar protein FliS
MAVNNAYKAQDAYLHTAAETMSRKEVLVKLYQHAEKNLVMAQMAIQNKQPIIATTCCRKARDIFVELHATLNMEAGGEIAERLASLYIFIFGEITEGSLRQDATKIAGILPTIATLREAWEQIPDEFSNTSSISDSTTCNFSAES